MANNLTGRPWIIDTAAATTIKKGRTFVSGFQFRDYTTPAHKAIVKDLVRNVVIWEGNGLASAEWINVDYATTPSVQDIAVTTLDSGVLEIFTK